MKPSEQRIIYSIATAFSIVMAITIIVVNLPVGSPTIPVGAICFLTGGLGFVMTYLLYQEPSKDSNFDEKPNIWMSLANLLTLSITLIMSLIIAWVLISAHIAAAQSGH